MEYLGDLVNTGLEGISVTAAPQVVTDLAAQVGLAPAAAATIGADAAAAVTAAVTEASGQMKARLILVGKEDLVPSILQVLRSAGISVTTPPQVVLVRNLGNACYAVVGSDATLATDLSSAQLGLAAAPQVEADLAAQVGLGPTAAQTKAGLILVVEGDQIPSMLQGVGIQVVLARNHGLASSAVVDSDATLKTWISAPVPLGLAISVPQVGSELAAQVGLAPDPEARSIFVRAKKSMELETLISISQKQLLGASEGIAERYAEIAQMEGVNDIMESRGLAWAFKVPPEMENITYARFHLSQAYDIVRTSSIEYLIKLSTYTCPIVMEDVSELEVSNQMISLTTAITSRPPGWTPVGSPSLVAFGRSAGLYIEPIPLL